MPQQWVSVLRHDRCNDPDKRADLQPSAWCLLDAGDGAQLRGGDGACEIHGAANTLGFSVDIVRPVNKNSESFSPADWLDVLTAIDTACASDAEGVVVLHGTDTMHYTLAAAGCFIGSKRVCFTGAMVSPELEGSDAHINLLAAMSFAADDAYNAGVYLAFCDNADRLSATDMCVA